MVQSKQSQVSIIAEEKRQSNFSKMKRKMKKWERIIALWRTTISVFLSFTYSLWLNLSEKIKWKCVCTSLSVCMLEHVSNSVILYSRNTQNIHLHKHTNSTFKVNYTNTKYINTGLGNWVDMSIRGTENVAIIYWLMEVRDKKPNSEKNANMNTSIQLMHWGPVLPYYAPVYLQYVFLRYIDRCFN